MQDQLPLFSSFVVKRIELFHPQSNQQPAKWRTCHEAVNFTNFAIVAHCWQNANGDMLRVIRKGEEEVPQYESKSLVDVGTQIAELDYRRSHNAWKLKKMCLDF